MTRAPSAAAACCLLPVLLSGCRYRRLRAIELGLNLGPHGLTARDQREVVLDARQSPPLTVTVPTLGVVPFHHVRTEEQIIRVMANGTDAFKALYSPLNRNA